MSLCGGVGGSFHMDVDETVALHRRLADGTASFAEYQSAYFDMQQRLFKRGREASDLLFELSKVREMSILQFWRWRNAIAPGAGREAGGSEGGAA